MKPPRTIAPLCAALLLFAGEGSAQPDNLPPRAFQRMGAAKLRHGSRILCLAYAQDGQVLAAGGGNDPVRLWNPKTGDVTRELNEPWVHALAFSPSGETLLYGGHLKVVKLWNFRLNKETGRLEGHKATVKAIAVAPDASVIATGSQDGAIYLWDMNNKRKVAELPGHTDEVNALLYYADKDNNTILVSAGSDRRIIIWNTENNQPKLKFDAGGGVLALAMSADGKTLYSAGDDYLIRHWDVATGKQTGVCKGHEGIVVSLILQGDTLISGALDNTVRYWDAKTGEHRRTLTRSPGDCDALAVTAKGDFLATAGLNNTIRIFETDKFKEIRHDDGIQAPLVGLGLAPDNKRLTAVSSDGKVLVWDREGRLAHKWDSKQTGEILMAVAPDNKTLAIASSTVRLWNAETGMEIAQLPIKSASPVNTLAFAPDGNSLALGFEGGAIEFWDVKEKKLAGGVKYPGSLFALAWSPDGKKIAAGGGPKIHVYDLPGHALVQSFDVKEGPPATFPTCKCLAFGPDSKTLAAGGFDGIIRIYNLGAKNPTETREQRICEGHQSAVYALAFSPDGRTLVTGSFDKTARLWEAFSGKQIAILKGHIGEVAGVAFGNDGRTVYSAGADTLVYHWDVPGLPPQKGKLPELTLVPQELDDAWTTLLTEDTARGHEMMWKCIASGKQAVPHLTKQKKLYLLDPERVKKLFKDLDSTNYPTRTAAQNELTGYGRWMEGRYDDAMANPPSLEYKRRVEILKDKLNAINSPSLAQERLRMRRIMLMCEQVGGDDAVAALRQVAERGPEEAIREEAQLSLQRMGKR
jgi:WD40 repeat protein